MKKTLMLMLFMVLALGLVAPAFAIHPSEPSEQVPMIGKTKIELGGSLRFRGDYRKDIISAEEDVPTMNIATSGITALDLDLNSEDMYNMLQTFFEGIPLVKHDENKAAYDGRVRLYLNAYVTDNTMGRVQLETGSSNSSDGYTWGCDGANDPAGVYTEGNCKKDELRVLEAWIQHTGSGLLGVPAGVKVGHMPLALGRKLFLNHTRLGDDAIDLWVNPMDNVQLDFVYTQFKEGSSTDADDEADAYALIGNFKGGAFNASVDVTYLRDKDYLTLSDGLDFWNFGIRGDANVDIANIYADVEIQTGKGEDKDPDGDTTINFKGWAAVVGATAKMADVKLNAEFGIGSGNDEDNFAQDLSTDGETDFNMFVTAQSSGKKFTYVYDYRMMTAALGTNTGIANTTYVKLGASGKAAPDLSAGADVYWLKATEDVLGENNLGWEVDGNITYNIDKNLQYFIEGGILFAGDFYDNFAEEGDADNPYVVRHGIQLAF